MNESNRNLSTFQAEPIRPARGTRPAIRYTSSNQQVPTPEPRKRLTNSQQQHQFDYRHQAGHQMVVNDSNTNINNNNNNRRVDDDYLRHEIHEAKLVTVKQQPSEDEDSNKLYCVSTKRTSFKETPVEFTTDEGVSSPSNIEYDDEDDVAGDYYDEEEDDDDEDYVRHYEQTDELTNLSRQSMVPLHELIAYYQKIQQGCDSSDTNSRISISRQSSSASQQTTRTKQSISEDPRDERVETMTKCPVIRPASQRHDIDVSQDGIGVEKESCELPFNKTTIPKLQVDHVDSGVDKGPKEEDESEKKQQNIEDAAAPSSIPVAPTKDKRRIRANVVLELINSERDFVKHLRDVVEGYLCPARRHPEIFTGERINTIFSNIEQLYEFQRKFLDSLEACINWDDLADSKVGHCFLEHENGFSVYYYYCNNHPNAISELQDLYTKPRFVKFFEACRVLQNMIDISLDGFLLTPIQKICKYPLQLNELLKNTDEDHLDYQPVASALESMRNCANLANERKRRIEALADVMSFQEKFENWFGPKLSDTSSILIHSGEVSKMSSHTWSQGFQLYLFDRLLIYCKKDLLKRNNLILKGRISMDLVTEISDADEYKSKKSFKLFCSEQQRWFVFITRSEIEKVEWIRAFKRERDLVEADESEGFFITEREIGVAKRALQNRKHSRSVRYTRHKTPDTAIVDQIDLDDANNIMNRTLSLPSCIHPSYVMNFCEESRVVSSPSSSSSRKKNSSPQNSSDSRSPISGSQMYLDQENQQQQQSAGSWFRKMGSKKLAKSQVYNVNGIGGSSSRQPRAVSPTCTLVESSATTKYDQLEKRHRDHMVSEEQARLFRLNNDLPAQIFPSSTSASTKPQLIKSLVNHRHGAPANNPPFQSMPPIQQTSTTTTNNLSPVNKFHLQDIVAKPVNFGFPANADALSRLDPNQAMTLGDGNQVVPEQQSTDGTTFETTVVLSSGRIVRVREDAV